MNFKLKAWMVYLIGVVAIAIPVVTVLSNSGFGTGRGFCDVESLTAEIVIICGAVLAIILYNKVNIKENQAKV